MKCPKENTVENIAVCLAHLLDTEYEEREQYEKYTHLALRVAILTGEFDSIVPWEKLSHVLAKFASLKSIDRCMDILDACFDNENCMSSSRGEPKTTAYYQLAQIVFYTHLRDEVVSFLKSVSSGKTPAFDVDLVIDQKDDLVSRNPDDNPQRLLKWGQQECTFRITHKLRRAAAFCNREFANHISAALGCLVDVDRLQTIAMFVARGIPLPKQSIEYLQNIGRLFIARKEAEATIAAGRAVSWHKRTT